MKISVDIKGLDAVKAKLTNIQRQARYAARSAINEVAKKVVEEESKALSQFFDRPTPATRNAVKLFKGARANDLEAVVGVYDGKKAYQAAAAAGFWKGGLPPAKWLAAEIAGGQRAPKRFERALVSAGIMPAGKIAIFAKRSNALDQYGNLPANKIRQILSWFQAFQEQGRGWRMNMKDKTKQNFMKGKRKGLAYGFAYFRGGRDTGLPDGIWERHYPNGTAGKSFVRPILLFVSAGRGYSRTFPFYDIAKRTVDMHWRKAWGRALAYEIATAK